MFKKLQITFWAFVFASGVASVAMAYPHWQETDWYSDATYTVLIGYRCSNCYCDIGVFDSSEYAGMNNNYPRYIDVICN